MGTGIDALAAGNCYLEKTAQDPQMRRDYALAFEPD